MREKGVWWGADGGAGCRETKQEEAKYLSRRLALNDRTMLQLMYQGVAFGHVFIFGSGTAALLPIHTTFGVQGLQGGAGCRRH